MIRFLDVLVASVGVIVLSPILILIMLILRLTGEGEVFYTQQRVGRYGLNFELIKFATMLKNSPAIGAGNITLKDDPRVLYFGKFLRRTKINEIPQLFNIVLGDMSLVGPRPMVPSTYEQYSQQAQEILNQVRPGLTGIGSLVFRDEEQYLTGLTDSAAFYKEKIIPHKSRIEIWFVQNKTLSLYFKIILATAWMVCFPRSQLIDKAFKEIPKFRPN